jgi:hypothetical protein
VVLDDPVHEEEVWIGYELEDEEEVDPLDTSLVLPTTRSQTNTNEQIDVDYLPFIRADEPPRDRIQLVAKYSCHNATRFHT